MTFVDKGIHEVAQWSVRDTRAWVDALKLVGREAGIARDVITEIKSRLDSSKKWAWAT